MLDDTGFKDFAGFQQHHDRSSTTPRTVNSGEITLAPGHQDSLARVYQRLVPVRDIDEGFADARVIPGDNSVNTFPSVITSQYQFPASGNQHNIAVTTPSSMTTNQSRLPLLGENSAQYNMPQSQYNWMRPMQPTAQQSFSNPNCKYFFYQ